MSWPSSSTRPPKTGLGVGASSPSAVIPSTLLPEPDSPTSPKISPGLIDRLAPRTACTGPLAEGKVTYRSSTSSAWLAAPMLIGYLPIWRGRPSSGRDRNAVGRSCSDHHAVGLAGPRKRLEHLVAAHQAVALQVAHRCQRRLVGGERRPAHAVADHQAAVVVLVGVSERVVHAHVRQRPHQHQPLNAVGFEHQRKLGGKERRVATLADQILVSGGSDAVGELGRSIALQAVDRLLAVELTTEVDQRALVHLLDEDRRGRTRAPGPAAGAGALG